MRRRHALLSDAPQSVDFAHYRSILNNTAIVDQLEQEYKKFKPITYDVTKELEQIAKFEEVAVKNALETKVGVDKELSALRMTLENIETARPFEELTVVCSVWVPGGGMALVWVIDGLMTLYRTMLRRLAQISMPGLRRWSRRAGGCQLATRRDSEISLSCKRSRQDLFPV